MAGWRNWQTQTAQNRPTARSWGFKSLARYHHHQRPSLRSRMTAGHHDPASAQGLAPTREAASSPWTVPETSGTPIPAPAAKYQSLECDQLAVCCNASPEQVPQSCKTRGTPSRAPGVLALHGGASEDFTLRRRASECIAFPVSLRSPDAGGRLLYPDRAAYRPGV